MPSLHICNTFFEQELDTQTARPLKNWLCSHSTVEQLQLLPLFFAKPDDKILVSKLPPNPDARLCSIDSPPPLPIEAWGPSQAIAHYAAKHELPYSHPCLSLVREIQSKSFAFNHSPLPGAALLSTLRDVDLWIKNTQGPKVLKRLLGFAGKGHFFIDRGGDLNAFIAKEFSKNRPVLGEPWLPRILDFSSQWEIGQSIKLLGITRFETSERGAYRATLAGPVEIPEWAVERHLEAAWPILRKIQARGFFGPVGIDAFVYGKDQLHPIVEINARKTMGRVALEMQRTQSPDKILRLCFKNLLLELNHSRSSELSGIELG